MSLPQLLLCNFLVWQALEYIGARVKLRRMWGSGATVKKNKVDEARDTLQATVLSHVPVILSSFLFYHYHCYFHLVDIFPG